MAMHGFLAGIDTIFNVKVKIQNKDVTEAIQKVAAAYDCKIVEGVLSHQLKQFVIDGNKQAISRTLGVLHSSNVRVRAEPSILNGSKTMSQKRGSDTV
ncbi:ERBB-3 BINDING PROTEIN 1 [Nymphaea thermarum]|nr:ERBB-3 BINDING PROTEIN 1 [Nymphaea thermarum]